MAQLPPKSPTMAHNWPSFGTETTASEPSNWMDEFIDFSSARRISHRRTVSDPIAFVEEECRNSDGFERLDDEQFSSMFSNDVSDNDVEAKPKPTPPLELEQCHHRQPKNEPETELDKPCFDSSGDGSVIVDPKRVKRILANRQSAQRSRVRKLQYISELERSFTTLQTEVSSLSPRVAFLDHQKLVLNVDNSALKQRIAALVQDMIFKDAHQEALKKEIERLRKVYNEQKLQKESNDDDEDHAPQYVNRGGTEEGEGIC